MNKAAFLVRTVSVLSVASLIACDDGSSVRDPAVVLTPVPSPVPTNTPTPLETIVATAVATATEI